MAETADAAEGRLIRDGASPEEIDFLMTKRVELNAFTSDKLVEWIEGKLEEHGVAKVIPDEATLTEAYRRELQSAWLRDRFDAALAYSERLAWAVLPLRGKVPAIAKGRGYLDATTDRVTISRWWREPDAYVGVACGTTSGIDVVDVDGEAGRATLAEVAAAASNAASGHRDALPPNTDRTGTGPPGPERRRT